MKIPWSGLFQVIKAVYVAFLLDRLYALDPHGIAYSGRDVQRHGSGQFVRKSQSRLRFDYQQSSCRLETG